MVFNDNQPQSNLSNDSDFTLVRYRELLRLAKEKYHFSTYEDIPWGERFILWRHDCDFSLNRSHTLAAIEHSEGLRTTYFLNLHSEFYNLFERNQWLIVKNIIAMGHHIGVHLDAAFYSVASERELSTNVQKEAALLEQLFDVKPAAFSFHNPVAGDLDCDAEEYGGLVNCYSRRFKTEVPYCSDSNGYWRFRRLHDVLGEAKDYCLQVLTHPGWWQATVMPPRQRVFRNVYGRARANMRMYDEGLRNYGRENLVGGARAIDFLRVNDPGLFEFYDFLWNYGALETLYLELWRRYETQRKEIAHAGSSNVKFLGGEDFDIMIHEKWGNIRHQLTHASMVVPSPVLEEGCVYMCNIIAKLEVK